MWYFNDGLLIQHNLFPLHQQGRFRASCIHLAKRAPVLWKLDLFTSVQRPYFNFQIINGSYFPSYWRMSGRCLWLETSLILLCYGVCVSGALGQTQWQSMLCTLVRFLSITEWRQKNEKWRTLQDGIDCTLQGVTTCSACLRGGALALGQ